MRTDVAAWLARARADAEARGLVALIPLLEGLARSTDALRNADPALTAAAGCDDHPAGPEGQTAGPDGPATAADASDTAE